MITVSYLGKNCFGRYCDREDSVQNETVADIQAAFKLLKAAAGTLMYTQDRAVYWDSLDDYEKSLVTERVFASVNAWDDRKVELAALRREWIARLKGGEADGNDAD